MQKRQEIFPEDQVRRINFCESVMARVVENNNFIQNILFTDESAFYLHGRSNPMITKYWSKQNKHQCLPLRTQYPIFLLMVQLQLLDICNCWKLTSFLPFVRSMLTLMRFGFNRITAQLTLHGLYSKRARNLEELRQKIVNTANTILPETLANVRNEFYYRLGYCQEQAGGLFEHLLH